MNSDPKHVVAGMSRYDMEYLKYYTGANDIQILSSLSGFYTAGHFYKPINNEVLLLSRDAELNAELKAQIHQFKVVEIAEKVKFRNKINNLKYFNLLEYPFLFWYLK